MPVLDASAILNAFPFKFGDEQYYTVHEVTDELKDFRARAILEAGINSGKIKVLMPSEGSVEKTRKLSGKTNLSETDIKVIALALDLGEELWTDDFSMIKVAEKLGIKSSGVLFREP
ncbi:MAG: hypothetical protein J7L23_01405 [Candidatus Diapherotrites archaeon]|nr:hypothetical protein [Candidatus Diapherotrites archaeon]